MITRTLGSILVLLAMLALPCFMTFLMIAGVVSGQNTTPYILRQYVYSCNGSDSAFNISTPDVIFVTSWIEDFPKRNCSYDEYGINQICETTHIPVLIVEGLTWNKSLAIEYGERWDANTHITYDYESKVGSIVRCGKDARNFIGSLGNSVLCSCFQKSVGFHWDWWNYTY